MVQVAVQAAAQIRLCHHSTGSLRFRGADGVQHLLRSIDGERVRVVTGQQLEQHHAE